LARRRQLPESAPRKSLLGVLLVYPESLPVAGSKGAPPRSSPLLIATRPGLEIDLTPSQQARKDFLSAIFSAISAPAPHLNDRHREFLIATVRIQKICNRMKTEEKRFSSRNKKTMFVEIGTPAARGRGSRFCYPH
jgi:hypothetical protein